MAHQSVGEARLLRARERGETVGRGRGQPAGIDVRGHDRHEPATEREAAVDPAAPAAEELGDLRWRELVVIGQRAHHARFVHRAERAARGVRLQQPGLAHDAGGVLDDGRHVRVAVAPPLRQALEPIEHLVGAVPVRGDA